MGIQKKIMLGFVAIGFILFLSGAIVVFEMSRITTSISGLLSDNVKSIDAAKSMQRLLYKHNEQILRFFIEKQDFYQDSISTDTEYFERKLGVASKNITIEGEGEQIDRLNRLYGEYKLVLKDLPTIMSSPDSVRRSWYMLRFRKTYSEMYGVTDIIMDMNQSALGANSLRLETNYYRMIMPAIIALSAGLLMIVLFNYFVNLYFVKPVLKMLNAISGFLATRVPYNVNIETTDEIGKLNSKVKELTAQLKKKD